MAQPVWTLSVDLQTKTATFQSGLADAARSARGSFNDIKQDAKTMGAETSYSMMEARHAVMILGEEVGAHLPRALTSFIASLGPIGPALEAAFPFLAVALGATLLIEHLVKMREEAEKAANASTVFGTTVAKAFEGLDDKMLRTGIQMDDLTGNHLAALRKELELIDHASLAEVVQQLDIFAKAADVAFAETKTSWYQFTEGSRGAKHALEDFKVHYDSLLSQGKSGQAHDLLAGTLESAKKARELMESSAKSMGAAGMNEKQIAAQDILVGALNAQVTAEQKIADLKKAQDSYANAKTGKTMGAEDDKKWREMGREVKQEADDAEKAWDLAYKAAVSKLQESEKQKIDATRAASAERLAAIDAAIKEENAKGLQETGYYKSLLVEKVNVTRQMGEERAKVEAEIGKEIAETDKRMGDLAIAAEREYYDHRAAMTHVSDSIRLAEALTIANEEYAIQMTAYNNEIQALDKHGKDYELKLKQIQDRETELTRAHENEITRIKDKAEQERNARIIQGERHLEDEISRGLANVVMRHQSFASMMAGIGDQILSGMLQNAIKSILTNDMTKESDAAAAARKAYLAGMHFPFPVNIVMGPLLGAAAFASVMAFAGGGIVPGHGDQDNVPIMATPGEAVMPKKLTEGLTRAANGDGLGGGGDVHVHHHATYNVQAFDSMGVDTVLQKHSQKFADHVGRELRKRNR